MTAGGYNVVQPMQAVTVDGQEALFIPAQHQAVQLAGSQALITPTGQIIRAPGVYPTGLVQNVHMSNGKQYICFDIALVLSQYTACITA